MIPELTRADIPSWLRDVVEVDARGRITTPFLASKVLERSVYYPASGLDGNPLERLGAHFASFVYADYDARYDGDAVRKELSSVAGYRVLGDRLLSRDELDVGAWTHAPGFAGRLGRPFALWTILERLPTFGEEHGPRRLSFLFLGADGVATYEGLYAANGLAPAVLAIVHPGAGTGGNWTNFDDPRGALCKAVLKGARPAPQYLYAQTGAGGAAPWPSYDHHVATLHAATDIHLWERQSP